MLGLDNIGSVTQWAIILMIGVPLITIAFGEIIDRLRRNDDSNFAPFFIALRAVVLPVVVFYIVMRFIFDLGQPLSIDGENDAVVYRTSFAVTLTILYLTLAYAAFIFMRALNAEQNPKAWENRIPGLFKAIMSAMVFVVPVIAILSAWGIQLGNFAKYAALAAAAIGLALQDALSSVTKGFLLVLDKPFAVGDWIEVDGVKGKVTDISWRSTRLQVAGNDIVVIPNLIISDNSVYNYTAEDISYRDDITLGFSYGDPPNKVKAILRSVLEDCPDVMTVPAPKIFTVSYDDFSIGYKCYFFVKEYVSAMDQERIRDDIMNRIWYAADRGGISIPFPIQVEAPPEAFEPDVEDMKNGILKFLKQNRYFQNLDEAILRDLSDVAEIASYASGETIYNEGDLSKTLGLVRRGEIIFSTARAGEFKSLSSATPHDLISEVALMGRRPLDHKALANGDAEILKFDPQILNPIIEANPSFARQLNDLIESRLFAIRNLPSDAEPSVSFSTDKLSAK